MRNLNYIAIEGPIGVGKTSLAKLLSKRLSAKLILEKFEEILFYQNSIMTQHDLLFRLNYFFFSKDISNNKILGR